MRGMAMSRMARSMSPARRRLDGLGAVARLGDDLQVGLAVQDQPQAAADQGVVVGEQDAGRRRSRRHCRTSRGHRDVSTHVRCRDPGVGDDGERAADEQRAFAHAADAGALGRAVDAARRRRRCAARTPVGVDAERQFDVAGVPRGGRRWSAPPGRSGSTTSSTSGPSRGQVPAPGPRSRGIPLAWLKSAPAR